MKGRGRPPKGSIVQSDLPELIELWNRAMATPKGIKIESAHPKRLAAKLYAARREVAYDDWNRMKVVTTDSAVWIVPT